MKALYRICFISLFFLAFDTDQCSGQFGYEYPFPTFGSNRRIIPIPIAPPIRVPFRQGEPSRLVVLPSAAGDSGSPMVASQMSPGMPMVASQMSPAMPMVASQMSPAMPMVASQMSPAMPMVASQMTPEMPPMLLEMLEMILMILMLILMHTNTMASERETTTARP